MKNREIHNPNGSVNETNTMVRRAFINTSRHFDSLLAGAFSKHGNSDSSSGSRFVKPGWYTSRKGVEHYLFGDLTGSRKWQKVSSENGVTIVEAALPHGDAVNGAVPLSDLPPEQLVRVDQLGYHPTLVASGLRTPTDVVTAVIYDAAENDRDLAAAGMKGAALVTWHPGRPLLPSEPRDCAVGDLMTAAEAAAKGWRVVCWTQEEIKLPEPEETAETAEAPKNAEDTATDTADSAAAEA